MASQLTDPHANEHAFASILPPPPHLQATVQRLAGDKNNEMKLTCSAILSAANWTATERIRVI